MSEAARRESGIVAAYIGFLLTGTATVVLGPFVRVLEEETGRPPTTFGVLFLIQFTAHALGAIVSSGNVRNSFRAGYPLIVAGLFGLAWGWPIALVAVAVMGFGLGLVIPATNILVAQRHPTRRAAALSHLNLLWGAGAIGAPLVFAALRPIGWAARAPLVLSLLVAVVAVQVAVRPPTAPSETRSTEGIRSASAAILALFAMQMFLYTGAESAVGGWIISLTSEHVGAHSVWPEIVGMSFWLAILAGRAALPAWLRRHSESAVHRVGLGAAAVAVVVILASHSIVGFAGGTILCGLAFAPMFPILAAGLVAYTTSVRPGAAGPVFAIAGFGAGALPWLAGQVAQRGGSVRGALIVPAIGIVLMALLHGRERLAAPPPSDA
jgi:fucose permease